MRTKEEILTEYGCPDVPFDENVTMYYPAILSAMDEYRNQPTERKGVKAVEEPNYEQKFRESLDVLKRLSFAAQTTGGTAGPDIGLQGVISEAERFIKANKG